MEKAEKKKWMFTFSAEQYNWIKTTAEQAHVQGVTLMRTLIDKAMSDKSGRLQTELGEAQIKAELQQVNDEIAEREERRQQLSKQLRRDKVLA